MKRLLFRLSLSLVSIIVCLVVLECALRGYRAIERLLRQASMFSLSPEIPLHIPLDSPVLYGLNPEHPEVNSQGLRDDEVSVPKSEGTFRVLILGDSIAYGTSVSRDKTFSSQLEHLLQEDLEGAEVVNAAVTGYTPYNELQYYLTRGRTFEPDVVVVAFCMNDVVNPRLHWGYYVEKIIDIPDQAIPNRAYDLESVLPRMLERRQKSERWMAALLEHSELYGALEWRIKRLRHGRAADSPGNGSETPTYITGEDTLSIEVLLHESSPERKWLASIYDQLDKAVRADHATLIVALFPLAYQLDENYPFFPQKQIAAYCRKNSILCMDLLESFRRHPKEDLFLLGNSGYYDIWHLTEHGHSFAAEEILRFLQKEDLLPKEGREE